MKTFLKLVLVFVIFSILFVVPAMLIPVNIKWGGQSQGNGLMLFLLLLTDFLSIIYLINRRNLSGMKLFLAIVTVFWGLQTIMTQIETWYFRAAMPTITDFELRNLFIRPLITSITFIRLLR